MTEPPRPEWVSAPWMRQVDDLLRRNDKPMAMQVVMDNTGLSATKAVTFIQGYTPPALPGSGERHGETRLDELKRQINALGWAHVFFTKKEVNFLPTVLLPSEHILGLTSGVMNNSTWLIVLTERRVVFLDKGIFGGLKQVESQLDKITAVEQDVGWVFGKIAIWGGSTKMTIDQVPKETISSFVADAQPRNRESQEAR